MVTRLPWIADSWASSNNWTMNASAASCIANNAVAWYLYLLSDICLITRLNDDLLISRSVDFWNFLVSRRATVPGLYLYGVGDGYFFCVIVDDFGALLRCSINNLLCRSNSAVLMSSFNLAIICLKNINIKHKDVWIKKRGVCFVLCIVYLPYYQHIFILTRVVVVVLLLLYLIGYHLIRLLHLLHHC